MVEPDGVADDLGRESVSMIVVGLARHSLNSAISAST
jgi:hypothetical protein